MTTGARVVRGGIRVWHDDMPGYASSCSQDSPGLAGDLRNGRNWLDEEEKS